jgi:hypothetical protein
MEYDLNPLETRRMHLAGTVPFPTPFPTVGTVWLKAGKSTLVIEDPVHFDNKVTKTVYLDNVAAIFAPDPSGGDWSDPCGNKCIDFERGKWFFGKNIITGITSSISSESFPGIVFVAADAPVFSRVDLTLTAAKTSMLGLPMMLMCGCLCCPYRP